MTPTPSSSLRISKPVFVRRVNSHLGSRIRSQHGIEEPSDWTFIDKDALQRIAMQLPTVQANKLMKAIQEVHA